MCLDRAITHGPAATDPSLDPSRQMLRRVQRNIYNSGDRELTSGLSDGTGPSGQSRRDLTAATSSQTTRGLLQQYILCIYAHFTLELLCYVQCFSFLANVNSSLYVVVRPSVVCL